MENEKTVYEELEIEVIRFEEDNVITESGEGEFDEDEDEG